MGTLVPQQAAAVLAALLAVSFFGATAWNKAEAAAPPPVVVGSIKCLDCSPDDVNSGDAFKDLQVAIKCKSGTGAGDDKSYETKALGPLDDTGVFRIPLAAELLRDDGSMDRDCFAQLHTSLDTPCVGQAPPRIAPTSQLDGGASSSDTTYLAAADGTVFAPVACACGKKKKKHFMFGPPPPPPRPTPTPTPSPPTYGPPTPTPTPVPEPRPPAPEEPEPFFKKKPKMKFMHKKKPCPPLVDDDDTTRPAAAAGGQEVKLPKKLN